MATQASVAPSGSGSSVVEVRPTPALRLSLPSGTLRLRATRPEPAEQRHIQWADDVVDNEGMGKKSSKVCCIYHKPKAADESSDESSSESSSDSDSDSEPDTSRAHPVGGRRGGHPRGRKPHQHDHDDGHDHDYSQGENSKQPQPRRRPRRKPSPNAYEKMPKKK